MTDTTLITLTQNALKLAKVSIALGCLAIGCFLVFGTLASMAHFKDSTLIYYCFHYLPYVLIGLSVPISLYQAFLLWRYRLIQQGILVMALLVAVILSVFVPFMGVVAWFALPYLFKVNLTRFLKFLNEKTDDHPNFGHHGT